jgi:hypothetical protein
VSIELLLTFAAVTIAAVSLYFNLRQHRQSQGERSARAEFEVTVRTIDADEDGVRWTEPNTSTQITRIAIGVKNRGDRAAGETLVNVLVPESLEYARWSGPNGEELPDGKQPAPTPERLSDRNGEPTVPSKSLSATWDRIGLRPNYEKYVTIPVELPPIESGLRVATVPIRVKVEADELPEDVPEYVTDYTVRVVRRM